MSGSNDPVLFIEEVAAELRLNHQTIRAHIRAGRLRATKQGNRWFILRSAVDAFKRGEQVPAAS
jgi:excisionase family DNA binding protein